MSCFIDQGYTLDCRNASIGGIKELWILGDSGHTISSYTTSGTDEITSFSGAGTWYKFELVKQCCTICNFPTFCGSILTKIKSKFKKSFL
jgi:hypothetical protein